jgi:integrase
MGPRVRDFLSAVWRWADQRADRLGVVVPPLSFSALPKVGAVQQERERALTPAEIWRLWRATETAGAQGLALRFMILTATRVKETLNLAWGELDLERALWRLPAARNKSARERTIPLSREALAILERRRQADPDQERVFGSSVRLDDDLMARLREAVGGEPWEARDLRRTAATLCARLGADPFTVSLVLGHANADERMPAVTRTYLRWDYAEKVREALARLGEWTEETVRASEEPGAIVEMRR